ncbi:Fur family transcriptional regulator [Bacteroidota bacterium]
MTNSRTTNQRLKIMSYLKSVYSHPTAETVFNHVKKELPQITLATVYRNLNLLSDQGLILRLEIDKEYHYDAFTEKHQHGVCENCGKIMDLKQPEITDYALKTLKSKTFKADTAMIMFRGLCTKCAR